MLGFRLTLSELAAEFSSCAKRSMYGYEFEFPNGWGASIVSHSFSYGGREGLWELAVLKDGKLDYSTDITNDVVGHIEPRHVYDWLAKVASLNEKGHLPL